jgi:hypothetical protein
MRLPLRLARHCRLRNAALFLKDQSGEYEEAKVVCSKLCSVLTA